jgi:acyl-CoA reductase-like NAD-dependent aldehyde dehydrogenase
MLKTLRLPALQLFINNEWIDADNQETFDVLAPAEGRHIAQVSAASAADVDRAVRAAHHAFTEGPWSMLTGAERGRLLWRLADLIEENAEELAQLESTDVGRPINETLMAEVPVAAETFRHFAGWADKITGETFSLPPVFGDNRLSYTLRQPLGVIGAITPWNAPTMTTSWKIAPALAAGNTVVLKPATDAPLTALRLAELALEAGFPPGVLNVVPGRGQIAGDALVEHPLVTKISFTGSTAVGRGIGEKAGVLLKKVDLELGGKSPQMIWPDADLDKAAISAAASFTYNQGQTCASTARIYIHRDVFDEMSKRIVAIIESIRIGQPLDTDTTMGSLINEKQLQSVLSHIASARSEGAELLTGGERIDRDGFFIQPTVFTGNADSLTIAREEIFGPVGLLVPFDDDDEVLKAANATEYGLTAVLWTNDSKRINRFTRALEAGVVWVNAWGPPHPAVPWIGIKASGIGEELGLAGLHANTQLKTVHVVSA